MHKRVRLWAPSEGSREGRERALMVWEPVPELCISEQRVNFKEAVKYVDIVSPNAEELAGFFTSEIPVWSEEKAAKEVLAWGIGPHGNGVLVTRQGSKGCTVYLRECQFHLRAYHLSTEDQQSTVVDPTGGGNAFLGALALAMNGKVTPSMSVLDRLLVEVEPHKRLLGALIYATIAASFVIEQPGMPLLSQKVGEKELWNGELFEDRLVAYLHREHDYIAQQFISNESSVSS
jgi:sugar/nucleoside kinase (ribokinase family)